MKPNEIRAELVLKGITITSIAKAEGTKQPNVSAVISGNQKTKRIQVAVAKAIGKTVEEVFPITQEAHENV